jgi:glycosyltransferase involved in cell wall biosynthesis
MDTNRTTTQIQTPHQPKVSIGMPVYNGEHFIREALDSLLAQTFTEFELIISDNGSSDATEAICKEYAAKDRRIRYVRQAENRGAGANFQFVLDESVGEYFMWAAADDRWGNTFVEQNYCFLVNNNDFVGSISNGINHQGKTGELAGCTIIGQENFDERVKAFMQNPASNSRFYSLFRRHILLKFRIKFFSYIGGDWSIIIEILRWGKLYSFSGEVQFEKSAGISANLVKYYDDYRLYRWEYLFPFGFLILYILNLNLKLSFKVLIILHLLRQNFSSVKGYCKTRLGNYLHYTLVGAAKEKGYLSQQKNTRAKEITSAFKYLACLTVPYIRKKCTKRFIYLVFLKYIKPNFNADVNLRNDVNSNLRIDVFIPAVDKDLKTLPLVVDGIRRNIRHPIDNIFIVSPFNIDIQNFCAESDCVNINEENLIGYGKKKITYNVDGLDRSGWLYQQLLKLSLNKIAKNRHVLVVDADTVFVRPRVFEYDGKIIFDHSTEHHSVYYDVYKKLMKTSVSSCASFVTHYMLFDVNILQEMKDKIECIHKLVWDDAILKCVNYDNISGFSEYETYGNFIVKYYPKKIIRDFNFNMPANFNNEKNKRNVKSISYHSYIN